MKFIKYKYWTGLETISVFILGLLLLVLVVFIINPVWTFESVLNVALVVVIWDFIMVNKWGEIEQIREERRAT